MIATAVLILFILLTNYMKYAGIKLIKVGKSHGIFVIMSAKIMFWLSLIEIVHIWSDKALIYFLPIALLLFIYYVIAEKKLYFQSFKRKKLNSNK